MIMLISSIMNVTFEAEPSVRQEEIDGVLSARFLRIQLFHINCISPCGSPGGREMARASTQALLLRLPFQESLERTGGGEGGGFLESLGNMNLRYANEGRETRGISMAWKSLKFRGCAMLAPSSDG